MNTPEIKKNRLLLLILGLVGAYSVISQTIILRELLVVLSGNEFFFGIIFSSWLIGIVTGALIGGRISSAIRFTKPLFIISILILLAYFPVLIGMIRNFYAITGSRPGTFISLGRILFYLPVLIMPFTFFFGFMFPFSAKLIRPGNKRETGNTGKINTVYIFESAGALAGGAVYTFFLAGKVSPFLISPILSLILLLSLYFFSLKQGSNKALKYSVVFLAAIFIISLFKVDYIENKTIEMRWSGISTIPLVFSTDTKYQNISISKFSGQFNLYLNGRLSGVFPNDYDNLLLSSHLYVQHPRPEKILILGEGVSGLCKNLERFNFEEIVSIEIDRGLIETINRYLPDEDVFRKKGIKTSYLEADGRKYIKNLIKNNNSVLADKKKFDMVFINQGEPGSLFLNRYYTTEFYRDIRSILTPDGTIALGITSSDNYDDGIFQFYTSLQYKTLKSVFKKVVLSSGAEAMLFGSNSENIISSNPDILKERYIKSGVEPEKLAMVFESIYFPEKIKKRDDLLTTFRDIPVNSDKWPVALFHFSRIEGAYRGIDTDFFYSLFIEKKILLIVLPVLGLVLLLGFLRERKIKDTSKYTFAAGYALFIMGISGISLELILIYIFQISFGFIYNSIGLIIAFFMAGLPLGALFSYKLISLFQNSGKFFAEKLSFGYIFFMILMTISTPVLIGTVMSLSSGGEVFILILTGISGFLTGGIFPCSVFIINKKRNDTGKVAAVSDALDHLGGAVGALLTGTFLVPLYGIQNSAVMLVIFQTSALIILAGTMIRKKNIIN